MTGGPKERAAAAGSSCGQIETAALQRQYTAGEMMRTGRYYWLSLAMALAVPAYVLVNPLMMSLGMERGLTGAQALAGVTAASAANIIGRVAAPWLSDRAGRKPVVYGLFVIAMAASFGLMAATGMMFAVLCSAICMVYGGVVSVFPGDGIGLFWNEASGNEFWSGDDRVWDRLHPLPADPCGGRAGESASDCRSVLRGRAFCDPQDLRACDRRI